ncbi:Flp family type IVb pilin [Parvularcula oceani]|uniref:Flp family type IVb pilin n=1 Tax=Parvularcula oceani TaxID=1247963 RepID=UPI0012DDD750|nr:hypothetical protein [Parvularcula oceani]
MRVGLDMLGQLKRFWRDEGGGTMLQQAIIIAFVATILLAIFSALFDVLAARIKVLDAPPPDDGSA